MQSLDDIPFTPEALRELAKQVEDLRETTLFSHDGAGADPVAEQHYLAALAYLELAHRNFKLAHLAQVRAFGSTMIASGCAAR